MALIENKFRRRLHCDKKECAENLKQSIKIYDYLKTSTMGVVKAKAAKAEKTLGDDVKTSINVVPGKKYVISPSHDIISVKYNLQKLWLLVTFSNEIADVTVVIFF